MYWTKVVPTEPGWYWFREGKGYSKMGKLDTGVKVVKLAASSLGLLFLDGRLPSRVKDWPGEWAGPLPEPRVRGSRRGVDHRSRRGMSRASDVPLRPSNSAV